MQYLKYTKWDGYYVKRTDTNGYSLVKINEATKFNDGQARVFLNTTIPFDQRKHYEIIQCDRSVVPEKPNATKIQEKQEAKDTAKIAYTIQQYAVSQFSELKSELESQLNYYDSAIIDILHFIGDENCRLNAVQLCKVAQKLQEFERGHTKTKKELRRIESIMDKVNSIKSDVNNFNYMPYKPRVLHSIDDII